MGKLAKSLSEVIDEVNEAFIHTKMLIRAIIVNIFSSVSDPHKQVSMFAFVEMAAWVFALNDGLPGGFSPGFR